jgi:hypothetical protein
MPSRRSASNTITVIDHAEAGRYEILRDGALAGFSDYRDRVGRRIFVHTEVDPAFAGQGLATRLIAAALDDAVAKGLRVVPRCPFVRAYLERHRDHPANRSGTEAATGGPGST